MKKAISDVLPFPRGSTWSDKSGMTLTASIANELTGRLFVVKDTQHDTGIRVILRCVRTNVALTVGGTASVPLHQIFSFDGDTKDWGTEIDAITGAVGEVGKPIDDAYPGAYVIPQYDLCYVVEEGPTKIGATTSMSVNAHLSVTPGATGLLHTAQPGGDEYLLGTSDAILVDSVDNLVYVNSGTVSPDDNS